MTQATMDIRQSHGTPGSNGTPGISGIPTTPALNGNPASPDINHQPNLRGIAFAPVEVAAAASASANSPTASSTTGGFLSRPHVLAAAAACFDELGYDGLTIRAIAGRLGCSVGSIYRYFTDKRELLLACCSQVLEPVADALENDSLSFEASVAFYVQQARAMSEQYRLMFWLCGDPRKLPVTGRILASWAAQLGDIETVRARWAMLHGLLVIGEDEAAIVASVTWRPAPAASLSSLTHRINPQASSTTPTANPPVSTITTPDAPESAAPAPEAFASAATASPDAAGSSPVPADDSPIVAETPSAPQATPVAPAASIHEIEPDEVEDVTLL